MQYKCVYVYFLFMFVILKSDPLFAMLTDSADSSGSQSTYQSIMAKHPTCFPEQHQKGYEQFLNNSDEEVKMYKKLYGRKAPLVVLGDEIMTMGKLFLSGKTVACQHFLPEGWRYSAKENGGVIITNEDIYCLSPKMFECMARAFFFLPAQEFYSAVLTYNLSQEDQVTIKSQLDEIKRVLKGFQAPNKLDDFKPLPVMRADRDTSAKIRGLLEDLKYHRANGIFLRDQEGKFNKFCFGLEKCIPPLESVLNSELPLSYKDDVIGGIEIIAKEIEELHQTKSLFLEKIPEEFRTGRKPTVKITIPDESGTFSRSQEITPLKLSTTLNLVAGVKSFSDKYALLLMHLLSDFEGPGVNDRLDTYTILVSSSADLASLEGQMQQILLKHSETSKKK